MNNQEIPEKENENEYENATLEEKVESLGFWVQDSLGEIHSILKQVIQDHYEPDPEGKKTTITYSMEQIEIGLGEIGNILNTLEAL